MNNLTLRPTGGILAAPPSFEALEQDLQQLQAARELSATSHSATPELLAALDRAMAIAGRRRPEISAAAAPANSTDAGAYLLLLTRAYPNSGHQDGKGFGRLLLEDVLSLKPTTASVDIACRKWRRNNKFLPAISEIMAEIRAADSHVKGVAEFVDRLPALRDRIVRELDES